MKTPELLSSAKVFLNRRVLVMLLLGFSAGLPILLIFGTLSVWLREAGVARAMVTYFSWAALGYSFKFVWAPLVDQLDLPILSALLGRRRSWLLLSQCMVMVAIVSMAGVDPAVGDRPLVMLAVGAVLLGFSSATQDIVIDAFRIESASAKMQAILSSTYIAGYRIAMIVAGAGALFLAEYLGSEKGHYSYTAWRQTYLLMAGIMVVGIVTTLSIKEPKRSITVTHSVGENLQLVLLFILCVGVFIGSYLVTADHALQIRDTLAEFFNNQYLAGTLVESVRLGIGVLLAWLMARLLLRLRIVRRRVVVTAYIEPVADFFSRYGARSAWLLLALVGLYRISDIVLGVISNVFYYDLGFAKSEIAAVSKVFGLIMTIVGGFLGGLLSFRYGVMKILLLGAILSAATNLLFVLLAQAGHSLPLLYVVISADNLSAGLAGTAFVAFLSALTNIRFTAMQYAIFSSLMTLLPKILGGYSGSMVDSIGYSSFFLVTALIGVPVIVLILLATRWLDLEQNENNTKTDPTGIPSK